MNLSYLLKSVSGWITLTLTYVSAAVAYCNGRIILAAASRTDRKVMRIVCTLGCSWLVGAI